MSSNFFEFKLDTHMAEKTDGIHVFYSTDDDDVILKTVKELTEAPGIEFSEAQDMGHYTLEDMGTQEFPELIAWLVD